MSTITCNRCGDTVNQRDAIVIDGHYYCELPYGGCSDWSDTDWVPDEGYNDLADYYIRTIEE